MSHTSGGKFEISHVIVRVAFVIFGALGSSQTLGVEFRERENFTRCLQKLKKLRNCYLERKVS